MTGPQETGDPPATVHQPGVLRAARDSLGLLAPSARRRYWAGVILQMATSLLDLVGVLLIGLVGLLAAVSIQGGEIPSSVASILDRLGVGGLPAAEAAARLAAVAAVVLIGKSVLYGLLMKTLFSFLARRQHEIASRMVRQALAQSVRVTALHSSQELLYAIVTRAPQAVTTMLASVSIVLSEITVMLVLGVSLLLLDPVVTVVTVGFFVLLALVIQLFLGRWSSRNGRQRAHGEIAAFSRLQEALVAQREIYVLGRRGRYASSVDEPLGELATGIADDLVIMQLPKLLYEAALVVGVLALAAWQFATHDVVTAVATLALFLAAGFRLLPTMIRLNSQMIAIRGLGSLARPTIMLAGELDDGGDEVRVEVVARDLVAPAPDFVPEIEVREASYTYLGQDRPAVSALSLRVPAGGSLALVGRSGSGKSTLADLVLGVIEPDRGEISIGGLSPREAIHRWPGAIAYVPQMVATFNASVRDNILMGLTRAEVDDDAIWRALETARLADVFAGTAEGLDAMVGERGLKLSGGQRQRLGLARALLTGPSLLVLDEATSALDAETEQDITVAVTGLAGVVTTVTIAHRLTTVQRADVVAYLDDGVCVAVGTFDEIRASNEAFDRQADLLGIRS